jgi:membrane protein
MQAFHASVMEVRYFGDLLRRAAVSAYRDNCFGIAKGAAYSALLSFFPVLTTLTALLVQANAYAVSRSISRVVYEVVPPGTEEIVMQIFTRRGRQPGYLLVIAVLLAVWAASGVMLSLMEGFRNAYRIPKGRPFLHQRGIAALLVFAAAFPIVAASAIIVFGTRIQDYVLHSLGLLASGQPLEGSLSFVVHLLRTALSIGSIILGTTLLYSIGPNPPRRVATVLPGALLATWLWWLTTLAFAWYVRNIANYNVLYGSVGAVIALLVWMYLLSCIALYGCEFNAERDRFLGKRRIPG